MKSLGIIGTAGRKDDAGRLNQLVWNDMLNCALLRIETEAPEFLISGGAAWADHLAVELYRTKKIANLRLYLPADFSDKFLYPIEDSNHPGAIANYYHKAMSNCLHRDSLGELKDAINMGAEVHVIPGFKQRNSYVASKSDYLLAFTFGTNSGIYTPEDLGYSDYSKAGLKKGGTADTWSKSKSKVKEHVCLPMKRD